jgi:PIN domain nuclease of toxin-antitoxin system
VYVSSASIWESTIKIKLKKLDADVNQIVEAIAESGFLELPITVYHAAAVSTLPDIHRDPFDRILIAQTISEPLTFLTADSQLRHYSKLVEVID